MAENSDSRDSDNSWVIAGSGGFPVETVGPELGAATQTPADEEPAGHTVPKGHHTEASASPGKKSEGSQLNTSPCPEEAEFKDSEEYPRETPSPAASPRPGALGHEASEIQAQEGPGSEGPKLGSDTNTSGSAPTGRAGEPQEEGSSSEDDAAGLRWQQPQDSRQAPWGPAERRGAQAASDGESGLRVNSCLLGVLALLGIGLLAFSGAIYDPGDGPIESMDPRDIPDGEQQPLAAGVKDWLQQPPLDTAGDPQSLHSMSLLLDKLAKENQDIRLMQAELQLCQEGESAAAGDAAEQGAPWARPPAGQGRPPREGEQPARQRLEPGRRRQPSGAPASPVLCRAAARALYGRDVCSAALCPGLGGGDPWGKVMPEQGRAPSKSVRPEFDQSHQPLPSAPALQTAHPREMPMQPMPCACRQAERPLPMAELGGLSRDKRMGALGGFLGTAGALNALPTACTFP